MYVIPKLLIQLITFVVINTAIGMSAYFFILDAKNQSYHQAFSYLQSINSIKSHRLELFYNNRKADIQALAKNKTLIDLSNQLEILDTRFSDEHISHYQNYVAIDLKPDSYIHTFLKNHHYSDLYLIDSTHGHIMFNVNKKIAAGLNLDSTARKDTNMSKLWHKVLKTGQTHISDMCPCELDKNTPVMLVATPIMFEEKIIAVLMLEMPNDINSEIMHYTDGHSHSIESLLVGTDLKLRSDSLLNSDFTVKNSYLDESNYLIHSEAVKKAFAEGSGRGVFKNYRGIPVLSVYKQFQFDDFKWAILSEIDEQEVITNYVEMKNNIIKKAIVISFILVLLAYILMRTIILKTVIRPLQENFQQAKTFKDIINNSMNEIYIFNHTDLHFIYANHKAITNSGYTLDELKSITPADLKPQYSFDEFTQLIQPLIQQEVQQLAFETIHLRKDETQYPIELHLEMMQVFNTQSIVAIGIDISQRVKAVEEKEFYYKMATHDHLTHIFNRQKFDELFASEAARAQRYQYPISLALLDIDHFKKINDNFGHSIGDEVLIELTLLIQKHLRESDIFARWGGEEFVILMPHTQLELATAKSEELRQIIEKHYFPVIEHITCSFGLAQVSDFENYTHVFNEADTALYLAKKNGRNFVQSSFINTA